MITDHFISEHKTDTFKKGDKVKMHGCYEATFEQNKNKTWICRTDSYRDRGGQEMVFLEDLVCDFPVRFLQIVK